MTIIHIPDDIKQEFKIHSDGSTSVSIFAAAKLLDIDDAAFTRNRNRAEKHTTYTKYLDKYGFQLGADRSERVTDIEFSLAAKYYAYKAKVKSKQAESLDCAFTAIGVRTWIKAELGDVNANSKTFEAWEKLTQEQLLRLKVSVGCKRDFGTELDANFLADIDPVLWNMPLQVVEYLFYKNERTESTLWVEWYQRSQFLQDSFKRNAKAFATTLEELIEQQEIAKRRISMFEPQATKYLDSIIELQKVRCKAEEQIRKIDNSI